MKTDIGARRRLLLCVDLIIDLLIIETCAIKTMIHFLLKEMYYSIITYFSQKPLIYDKKQLFVKADIVSAKMTLFSSIKILRQIVSELSVTGINVDAFNCAVHKNSISSQNLLEQRLVAPHRMGSATFGENID